MLSKMIVRKIDFLSFRKQWYDYWPENSSIEFCKSTGLLVKYENEDRLKIVAITRALTIAQIYHLELIKEEISIEKLIRIIQFLPDLHTLSIDSLSSHQSKPFSAKELRTFSRKISKVCLQQLNTINDIDFLMALCPAMTCFQIGRIKNMTIGFTLHFILKKIHDDTHRSLRSLCLYHPTADDQLVKDLENVIVNENLLNSYSIEHVLNVIRLQWK